MKKAWDRNGMERQMLRYWLDRIRATKVYVGSKAFL